jgi:hypothetical protein
VALATLPQAERIACFVHHKLQPDVSSNVDGKTRTKRTQINAEGEPKASEKESQSFTNACYFELTSARLI